MIKGTMNRSSVGTLVERTTLMVVLAKMPDGTAQSALDGFSEALSAIPIALRKTFTYDQGREMSKHAQLTERTGIAVFTPCLLDILLILSTKHPIHNGIYCGFFFSIIAVGRKWLAGAAKWCLASMHRYQRVFFRQCSCRLVWGDVTSVLSMMYKEQRYLDFFKVKSRHGLPL